MYRLSPDLPLVWTSATSIQVGIDPPRAHLHDIPDNAAPLLHALAQGTPASGLAMLARVHRVSEEWVTHLVDTLRPALAASRPAQPIRLEAWSTSRAIGGLSALARQSGVEMVVPEAISDDHLPTGDTVVLVSDYLVHPRWADQLARENIPHLSVVFSDQTIAVGPLVTPGDTPCLVCVESHRRDDMVGWLEVSSQLWGKQSPLHTPTNIAMAWGLLLILLSPGGAGNTPSGFTRASYLADEGTVSWEGVDFHPRCSCRGLGTSP
jgi:bacteriocin biosynthesis cyclodehydratase domain-containing protein